MERCDTCRFFRGDKGDHSDGVCHRFPPRVQIFEESAYPVFTRTYKDHWCGEWREKAQETA